MAFYSFGGWKASLLGDTHVHGPEGVRFYTRAKAITSRWPGEEGRAPGTGAGGAAGAGTDAQGAGASRSSLNFPTPD
jgi:hypothetical protein